MLGFQRSTGHFLARFCDGFTSLLRLLNFNVSTILDLGEGFISEKDLSLSLYTTNRDAYEQGIKTFFSTNTIKFHNV